ncbi:MAG: hypothetical protein NTZ10_03905 [Candidatus Saganbacteria bacterium]|nr:hypothetical protein [Candidatus Saganbacteria bacterium]
MTIQARVIGPHFFQLSGLDSLSRPTSGRMNILDRASRSIGLTLQRWTGERKLDIKPFTISDQTIEIHDNSITETVGLNRLHMADSVSSPVRFINSSGANDSLIVTMYDKSIKRGLIANLDAHVDIESRIQEMLSHFMGSADVDVAFYGGFNRPRNRELFEKAMGLLEISGNTRIVETKILSTPSIVLDLATGNRYCRVGQN